ncbi:MAG: DUF5615 family PIN-like protein [Nitrospira sp.]
MDEHIPLTVSVVLQARGIGCVTTRDAGNLGCSDEAQLTFAALQRRAIFTFNHRDFILLARRWHETGRSHNGIILSKELALPDLIRRLHRFITQYHTMDFTNRVVWLPSIPRHSGQ